MPMCTERTYSAYSVAYVLLTELKDFSVLLLLSLSVDALDIISKIKTNQFKQNIFCESSSQCFRINLVNPHSQQKA